VRPSLDNRLLGFSARSFNGGLVLFRHGDHVADRNVFLLPASKVVCIRSAPRDPSRDSNLVHGRDIFHLGRGLGPVSVRMAPCTGAGPDARLAETEHCPGPDYCMSACVCFPFTAAMRFFGANRDAQRLFLSSRIDFANLLDFMADVDSTTASG